MRLNDEVQIMFDFFKKQNGVTGENDERVMVVIKHRCPQNHPCPAVRVCPVNAIKQEGYKAPIIDQEKCIKCAKCVRFCPMGALALE